MSRVRSAAALLGLLLVLGPAAGARAEDGRLRIGVTLPPYYSWVANIVGERAEVVGLLPEKADPHSYQPRPEDLLRLAGLDAVVVNGLGHDGFVDAMLAAAGRPDMVRIEPNRGLPLIPLEDRLVENRPAARGEGPPAFNSHSFLSITSAVQQINAIARELGRLRPGEAAAFAAGARAYAKRLRGLLRQALARLAARELPPPRIATVHDGYDYLFQELGLTVTAVVQPRHGINPSPRQLADTLRQLEAASVEVLFAEADYESGFAEVIRREAGTRLFTLTHLTSGGYTPQGFESGMAENLDAIVRALKAAP